MAKLDATLDDVQNTRFNNIYHDLARQMTKETQFTQSELECILMIYHKFVLANGPKAKYMTIRQINNLFLVLFKVYDMQIIERTILFISGERDVKKVLDPVPWVRLFSIFMSDDLTEKMKFAFEIYNGNTNSPITRDMVLLAVEKFFNGEDEDEISELRQDMVETIFKKFDIDKDGVISFEDYASVVTKQPMLLEFLGQCFPHIDGVNAIAYCANIMSKIIFPTSSIEE